MENMRKKNYRFIMSIFSRGKLSYNQKHIVCNSIDDYLKIFVKKTLFNKTRK
jgi:hypothetical protein